MYAVGTEVYVHGLGVTSLKGGNVECFYDDEGEVASVHQSTSTIVVKVLDRGRFIFHYSQIREKT